MSGQYTNTLPIVFENQTDIINGIDPDAPDRQHKIREGVKFIFSVRGKLGLAAGQLLWEIREKEYWRSWTFKTQENLEKPFTSFYEWCEEDVGVKQRKADYFLSIYNKFVLQLKIPLRELGDLDWTKAIRIFPILDEKNWEGVVKKAKQLTVKELDAFVDEVKQVDKDINKQENKNDVGGLATISFTLFPEQLEMIETALNMAKELCGSEKKGHLLDMICQEFVTSSIDMKGSDGLRTKLQWHIMHLQRMFGVKIEVTDDGFE